MTRPPLAYRLASLGLASPLVGHALYRACRDGGRAYLRGRLGLDRAGLANPVWVHCASVGEVAAAAPLLAELHDAGIGPLLVSTSTPTGRERARRDLPAGIALVYAPLDRPGAVRRFLARNRPRAALILETELWPHLFAALTHRDIPIVLVNGRLSPRTMDAPAWWRRTAGWCLRCTTHILARSAADRERFLALGIDGGRVTTVGSLKLAAATGPAPAPIDLGHPFVLAASTHADEELGLARAWRAHADAGHLLVIAPRHPERGRGLAQALAAEGLAVTRRSEGASPPSDHGIYLADTLGELGGLMTGAELVIMGGSFIPRGGQNVVEAARAGRAIITGPHMHNFADETARLAAAGALVQVDDTAGAVEQAHGLLADPERRTAMGMAAQAVLRTESDMAARYSQALLDILPSLRQP